MTPQIVAIVALSAMLLVAVSVALVAVWSAKGSQTTAVEAVKRRKTAETELANHLARHPKFGQCDRTCTADCGHCKGGLVPGSPASGRGGA